MTKKQVDRFFLTLLAVAFVGFVGIAVGAKTSNSQSVSPCLYEVIGMGDSIVIGWLFGRCDRTLDIRKPEDHLEIKHSIARTPCGKFGVWIWPVVTSPAVDTLPPWCIAPSEVEESHGFR